VSGLQAKVHDLPAAIRALEKGHFQNSLSDVNSV